MFGGIAKLNAKPGMKSDLLEFLRGDVEVSRHEPGTLRFDVWLDPADADAVILYETYVDLDAFKVHQAAAPFKKFMAEIVPNMVETVSFIVPFGSSFVSVADSPT
jgi:quinol monooxygenase YgiN